jgi:thiamine transporter
MKTSTKTLVEGAMMLALAIVLTFVTPFRKLFPFGGEITLVSMLPVCLFSIRHGIKQGLALAFLFAAYQFSQGLSVFGWGLTPAMLITCIAMDYFLAYTLLGLAGIFRKKGMGGWICGIVIALTLRFLCHFISGVVVFASTGKIWDELDFVAENKYVYSLVYNGAYMLPEIILTTIAAMILLKVPSIKRIINET